MALYVNQVDNMVIEAIFKLDKLDKEVNTFSTRLRLWYSRHFPELFNIVNDNYLYAEVVNYVENKSELSGKKIPGLTEILGDDEDKANEIVEAAKESKGKDLSSIDLIHVKDYSQRVMELAEYRKDVHDYLVNKMNDIAPDVAFVIGEILGARHAGYYIASPSDCFSETDISVFKEKFHDQVEERLGFYEVDLMKAAIDIDDGASEKKSSNETETKGEVELIDEDKSAAIATNGDASEEDMQTEKKKPKKKKNKKKKKEKRTSSRLPYTFTEIACAFFLSVFLSLFVLFFHLQ